MPLFKTSQETWKPFIVKGLGDFSSSILNWFAIKIIHFKIKKWFKIEQSTVLNYAEIDATISNFIAIHNLLTTSW